MGKVLSFNKARSERKTEDERSEEAIAAYFEEIEEKNKQLKERVRKERQANNHSTLKSYRIKK